VVALMGEYATAAIVKQDNKGDSPLHLAAQSGSLPAVTTLVEALGDQTHKVCLMTNHQHQTPIHYAVLHGNSEMLRVLLSTLSSIEKYQLFFPNHQKDRGLFNLARKNHLLGQGVLDHDIDQNTTVWQWLGVLWQMPRPNDAVAEDAQYIMTSKAEVIGPRSIPTPWLNGSSIKMYNTARQKLTQLFATLSQPERLRLIEQHRNDAPQVFQTDNASDAQRAMWEKLGLETTGAVASSKDTWETLDWDRKMQAAFDASLAEVQIPSERNAEARPSDNRHALFSQSNAASAPPSYDEVCTHQTRARSASF
jgi:hypothetical protein